MKKRSKKTNILKAGISIAIVLTLVIAKIIFDADILSVPEAPAPIDDSFFGPRRVFVDDDFDPSTPGWGVTRFDKIQDGIDAVAEGGDVFVGCGEYYERILIDKSISLIGKNKDTTVIDGEENGYVVEITADGVTLSGFTIQNGGRGLDWQIYGGIFVNSDENVILCNRVLNNRVGILIKFGSDNQVVGNVIDDSDCGIDFWTSERNIIKENTISNTEDYGILMGFYSNDNSIFHNNFVNNSQATAYDYYSNSWDDGYPSGGNFWSDYNGTDADQDGIGDMPYDIPGGDNQDRYPLMEP